MTTSSSVVAFLFGLLLLSIVGLLQAFDGRRIVYKWRNYRRRYISLISSLEQLVRECSQVGEELTNVTADDVIRDFESVLRTLELLIRAISDLPQQSGDHQILDPAFRLVGKASSDIRRVRSRVSGTGKPSLRRIWPRPTTEVLQPAGCYFCSRPIDLVTFREVRVKLDELKRTVFGCAVCCEKLARTKKVRVLFFERDGRQIHWSQLEDYSPSPEFFDINRDDAANLPKGLRLVVTEADSSQL